jgi:cobalamin biosynthesis Co2+ chelatase CbiK
MIFQCCQAYVDGIRFSTCLFSSFSKTLYNHMEESRMKRKTVILLCAALAVSTVCMGCGSSSGKTGESSKTEVTDQAEDSDQAAADKVAELIDAIYVQERTEDTDQQCTQAKAAWDALTDAQKELVQGEEADPDYFGRDTGDASLDDPRNQDEIGDNEILVVSFGTSFNDSRVADIKGIEDAIAQAYPEWSVRRAFTAQIIINHVQARDDEHIDNVEQALQRAVDNGVKNLVIQPTHLMHGAEYDELMEAVETYEDQFETVKVAEPLLGEVGSDATVINEDKATVAQAITAAAVDTAGYDSLDAAKEDGVAFVFMGHGTSHTAKVSYSQMQTQMEQLGYDNVFIGTVEGEPEETSCESVIEAVSQAGYSKVVLRPLMVVAGDHANNDMAGDDDDSWKSMFTASGKFEEVSAQIAGLGEIPQIQELYVAHTAAVME